MAVYLKRRVCRSTIALAHFARSVRVVIPVLEALNLAEIPRRVAAWTWRELSFQTSQSANRRRSGTYVATEKAQMALPTLLPHVEIGLCFENPPALSGPQEPPQPDGPVRPV